MEIKVHTLSKEENHNEKVDDAVVDDHRRLQNMVIISRNSHIQNIDAEELGECVN